MSSCNWPVSVEAWDHSLSGQPSSWSDGFSEAQHGNHSSETLAQRQELEVSLPVYVIPGIRRRQSVRTMPRYFVYGGLVSRR